MELVGRVANLFRSQHYQVAHVEWVPVWNQLDVWVSFLFTNNSVCLLLLYLGLLSVWLVVRVVVCPRLCLPATFFNSLTLLEVDNIVNLN